MRTLTLIGALALGLTLTQASAEDAKDVGVDNTPFVKDEPLPKLKVADADGEETCLTEVVSQNEATVIKFFDPTRDPVEMEEEGEALAGAETPFTKLYAEFKTKHVNWIFVAVGEPDTVMVLRDTIAKTRDDDVKESLEVELTAARTAYLAKIQKQLKSRGIEDYALYSTPLRLKAPGACPPACVIVRGELIVLHVAPAGDEEAITNLTSELHFAVNDPFGPATLPASAPR